MLDLVPEGRATQKTWGYLAMLQVSAHVLVLHPLGAKMPMLLITDGGIRAVIMCKLALLAHRPPKNPRFPAHLQVLRRASEGVFVPLTVGGGIRGFTDGEGRSYSARDVAAEYFRSGADKVGVASS